VIPEKGLTVMRSITGAATGMTSTIRSARSPCVHGVFPELGKAGQSGLRMGGNLELLRDAIERVFINQLKRYKSLGMGGSMPAFPR